MFGHTCFFFMFTTFYTVHTEDIKWACEVMWVLRLHQLRTALLDGSGGNRGSLGSTTNRQPFEKQKKV